MVGLEVEKEQTQQSNVACTLSAQDANCKTDRASLSASKSAD